LFGIKAAQLVLELDPMLAAKVQQVFALHVQFTRQGVDTNFLLQAALLDGSQWVLSKAAGEGIPPHFYILPDAQFLKRLNHLERWRSRRLPKSSATSEVWIRRAAESRKVI
jgi:hypothetical protein